MHRTVDGTSVLLLLLLPAMAAAQTGATGGVRSAQAIDSSHANTPIQPSSGARFHYPGKVTQKYDALSDSTTVSVSTQRLRDLGYLSDMPSGPPVSAHAFFAVPGRSVTAPPQFVAIIFEQTAVTSPHKAVAASDAAEVLFLVDDSLRMRYPVVPANAKVDDAGSGVVTRESKRVTVIPTADFAKIIAGKKVQLRIDWSPFEMPNVALEAFRDLLSHARP